MSVLDECFKIRISAEHSEFQERILRDVFISNNDSGLRYFLSQIILVILFLTKGHPKSKLNNVEFVYCGVKSHIVTHFSTLSHKENKEEF